MDFDQIRIKLSQQEKYRQSSATPSSMDWPNPKLSRQKRQERATVQSTESTKLSNAVEMLRKRAGVQSAALPVPADSVGEDLNGPALRKMALEEAGIHVKRLYSLADRINKLSSEQEHLIVEIRALESRLGLLQPYLPSHLFEPLTVSLDEAMLASAEGNDGMTYLRVASRSPEIPHPDQDAYDLANHLRGTYGSRRNSMTPFWWSKLWDDFGLLLQEPTALVRGLQGQFGAVINVCFGQSSSLASNYSPTPLNQGAGWESLSVVDMLLWFGSGVIGRMALNLVLTAIPGLWSLAVALLTGVTAYALYRATLAPRRDFGLAYRMFLVIAGLVIGGRF